MVTTRSQEKKLLGSELPLRSREESSPSSPTLKRPRTPTESARSSKRAKTGHASSPQVRTTPEDLENIARPASDGVPDGFPADDLMSPDEQLVDHAALVPEPPKQDVHPDQQTPLLIQDSKIEVHAISNAALHTSNCDPIPNAMRQEAIKESARSKELVRTHRRFGSDEPEEDETFMTAASSLEHENGGVSEVLYNDDEEDDDDDAPEVLEIRATQQQTQKQSAPRAKQPLNPKIPKRVPDSPNPSVANNRAKQTDLTNQPRHPEKPGKRLTDPSSPLSVPLSKTPQASRLDTPPPHTVQIRHQRQLQLRLRNSRISDTRPSSSLSRYKQSVLERHKRTPFWAGKKAAFTGVGVGVESR
jgi:hypothetical protein